MHCALERDMFESKATNGPTVEHDVACAAVNSEGLLAVFRNEYVRVVAVNVPI